MLAYNLHESQEIDSLIGYARKAQTASAYLVNKKILPELIATMENALENLIRTHEHWNYMNDTCWFPLQKTKEWYYLKDRIGIQRPDFSDCANKFVDHKC